MEKRVEIDLGRPNSEPQWRFFLSRAKYTCYGGARGGGKSWAVVRKAAGGAWQYPGIQILLVRREFDEMENTLIGPLLRLFPPGTASYNRTNRVLTLCNGSGVKFEMKQGELNRRIEAYKTALAAGEFARASWPHLAAWLDTTEEALSQVLRDGPDTPRGRLLRKTATWLRGQILSSEGWSGPNSSKGVFLLRQDVGDGIRYSDRPEPDAGPVEIKVTFGAGDERGREAFR